MGYGVRGRDNGTKPKGRDKGKRRTKAMVTGSGSDILKIRNYRMMMSSINHYKETKETNHITQEPVHMLRGYTKKGEGSGLVTLSGGREETQLNLLE